MFGKRFVLFHFCLSCAIYCSLKSVSCSIELLRNCLVNSLCSMFVVFMLTMLYLFLAVAALTPVAGTSTALAGELPYSCDASGNRRSHRLNQSSAPSRSRNYAATTVYDDDDNEDADEDEDVGSPSKYQENISNKREKSHPHHDSNYKEHATSDPKWSATWQDLKVDGQPSLSSSDDDETGAPKKRKKPNPDDDAYVESNHRHRTISGSDSSDAGEVFSEMKDRIVEPPRSSRFSSGRNSSASSSLSLTALKKVTRSGSRRSVGSRRTTQSTLTDRYSKHTCTEEANIKRAIENSITDSQSQPSESERERPCQEDWITAPSRRSSSSSVVTRREARDRNDIFPVQDLVSDNDDDCEPGAVSEGDAEKAAVASVSKICLSAGSGGVSGGSSGGGSWSSRGRSGGCLRKESEAEALCGTLVKPDSSRARSSAASSFSWTAASHPYRDDRDLPPAARINPMAMVDSLMERVYERKAYGGVSESPETEQDTEIQNDIFLNSAPPPPRQAQAHEDVDPSKHLETIAMHLNINSDDGTYSDPHETRKFNEGSARLLSSANRRHSPEQQDPLSQHEAEAETESAIQSLDVALSPLTPPRRSRRGVSPVISTATATATAMTGSKVAAEQSCRRGGDDGDVIDLTD